LAEIYSIICVVKTCICDYYSIVQGAIELGCDGLGHLWYCFLNDNPSPKIPHFDFINAIRQELAKFLIKWKWRYIKGHQDEQINEMSKPG